MTRISRRRLLESGGGLAAATILSGTDPLRAVATGQEAPSAGASGDITAQLARYMVTARDRELPDAVSLAAKHRLLDTLGAMILHLNDDHHWTREAIARWVAPPAEAKPETVG